MVVRKRVCAEEADAEEKATQEAQEVAEAAAAEAAAMKRRLDVKTLENAIREVGEAIINLDEATVVGHFLVMYITRKWPTTATPSLLRARRDLEDNLQRLKGARERRQTTLHAFFSP